MYPRNAFFSYLDEGACACSCERVVELLLEEDRLKLVASDKKPSKQLSDEEKNDLFIQKKTLEILQDRSAPLCERIIKAGEIFWIKPTKNEYSDEKLFDMLEKLLDRIGAFSENFAESAERAKRNLNFADKKNLPKRYAEIKKSFADSFPSAEIYFENILANHLVFEHFPYSRKGETALDKYVEFCLVYIILRFVTAAYTFDGRKKSDFVDCVAEIFRCFEHSDAERLAEYVLKKEASYENLLFALIKRV